MGFIDNLVRAIATAEGWFAPDRGGLLPLPRRNNNPGNLRAAPGGMPKVGGFVKFDTPHRGVAALYCQVAMDITRGLTLRQFIAKYAPPSENDTSLYLKETQRRLDGVDVDTPMFMYLGPLEKLP